MQFKIGDQVVYNNDWLGTSIKKGSTGTVVKADDCFHNYLVDFGIFGYLYACLEKDLKLVKESEVQ